MPKLMLILWLSLLAITPTVAEDVPFPVDQNARYYLNIPKDGLTAFLSRPSIPLPLVSHHRGGPAPGFPENAIETMDNALKYGYGFMEVDVAQLKDGTLILMHDDTLDRTTNGEGNLRNKTWADVKSLFLEDETGALTTFKVPLLRDVLSWAKGKTILTLDIKPSVDFKKVADLVTSTGAHDYTAAIAYSIDQAIDFHRLAPNMPMSVGLTNTADIEEFDRSGIPSKLVIAWTGTRLASNSHYANLHARNWRVIVGTLGGRENSIDSKIRDGKTQITYTDIIKRGADIIATDRFWAAQRELKNPNLFIYSKSNIASRP
ncbi:glycerophosphodiester phosphodiesterase family protein [Kordiimonas aquimaris]|uniref:glycerophosphodiester phosphodiesterase family protein n=1 Tax=Kordiimonas aquimaris TaxID=707591 RepID=UPI0021CF6D21|nr:glycerophosphodiester phosphodiesterase family protein [Kordiimonas aquimaris]